MPPAISGCFAISPGTGEWSLWHDQELLLRNEYLAAENRILNAQIKGRLLLSEEEKATLAEILTGWDERRWKKWRPQRNRICSGGLGPR
jgi:hypothetical protein